MPACPPVVVCKLGKSLSIRGKPRRDPYLAVSTQNDCKTDEVRPLCHLCQAIFLDTSVGTDEIPFDASSLQFPYQYREISHHLTLQKLGTSGEQGCQLCSLLLRTCANNHESRHGGFLESFYVLRYLDISDTRKSRGLLVLDPASFGRRCTFNIHGSLAHSYCHVYPDLLHVSMLEASTESETSFELVQAWFNECQETHTECSKQHGFLPTRLLHISSRDGSLRVRLISSTNLSGPVTYFTLSHCWGNGNHLKLLTKSLAQYFMNIPTELLSKTFIDAVQVTIRLGCSYVWIDSLCILQDDSDDWSKEAATMGEVYRCGKLNIAAASAFNGTIGCFAKMEHPSHSLAKLCKNANDPEYACPTHLPPSSYDQSNHVLLQRAWVVSERALAPRTLLYTSDMMYWECLESSASQMNWRLSPHRRANEDLPYCVKLSLAYLLQLNPTDETKDWHDLWWQIVGTYTACKLSFLEDRWTALSGVAKVLQLHTAWPLAAGLWTPHLPRELCWTAKQPSRRLPAPTWSWVSVDAPVRNTWMAPRSILVADVVDIPEPYKAQNQPNHFPNVGSLRLNAPLLKFTCGKRHEPNKTDFNQVCYYMNTTNWPNWLQGSVSAEWYPDVDFPEKAELWALQIIHDDFAAQDPYLRHTGRRGPEKSFHSMERSRFWKYEGLVVSSEDSATWVRLGNFQISVRTAQDIWLPRKFSTYHKVELI